MIGFTNVEPAPLSDVACPDTLVMPLVKLGACWVAAQGEVAAATWPVLETFDVEPHAVPAAIPMTANVRPSFRNEFSP